MKDFFNRDNWEVFFSRIYGLIVGIEWSGRDGYDIKFQLHVHIVFVSITINYLYPDSGLLDLEDTE